MLFEFLDLSNNVLYFIVPYESLKYLDLIDYIDDNYDNQWIKPLNNNRQWM